MEKLRIFSFLCRFKAELFPSFSSLFHMPQYASVEEEEENKAQKNSYTTEKPIRVKQTFHKRRIFTILFMLSFSIHFFICRSFHSLFIRVPPTARLSPSRSLDDEPNFFLYCVVATFKTTTHSRSFFQHREESSF